MRELKREKVQVRGKGVDVTTVDMEDPELPVLRVVAELVPSGPGLAGLSLSHTITIGPADGSPVNLTAEKLQVQVNALRQEVAERLVARAEARQYIAELK